MTVSSTARRATASAWSPAAAAATWSAASPRPESPGAAYVCLADQRSGCNWTAFGSTPRSSSLRPKRAPVGSELTAPCSVWSAGPAAGQCARAAHQSRRSQSPSAAASSSICTSAMPPRIAPAPLRGRPVSCAGSSPASSPASGGGGGTGTLPAWLPGWCCSASSWTPAPAAPAAPAAAGSAAGSTGTILPLDQRTAVDRRDGAGLGRGGQQPRDDANAREKHYF